MTKNFLLLIVAIFTLIGKTNSQYCTNNSRYSETSYFDLTEITIGSNIQYGIATDFEGNPDTLLMDFYYPNLAIDSSSKRPFILLFHGGGFSSGDKQSGDIKDLCIHMAKRGFVSASVNYRLGHDFSEYGQYKARYRAIQDGNAALRFVVNNSNTVRIDTNWLFVGGQSAGALTALGIVYGDQFELDSISLHYNTSSIGSELGNLYLSGNKLINTYTIKGVFNNWGGGVASEIDSEELLPTIAFHGEKDTTVLIDSDNSFSNYTLYGSRALHNKLIANNVCSEITIDTSGEHGIFRNESAEFRAQRASCFFKSIFCNNCINFYSEDSIPSNCTFPLNIDDNIFSSTIKIFPNPFETEIEIKGIQGVFDLKIYNSIGQMVYNNENSTNQIQLDLLPGIYFLNLKQKESNIFFTNKLIKF